jgi:hypothetical protein
MVVEVYRFLKAAEIWIYVILGFIIFLILRKLINAIREYRGTLFGMERERIKHKIVQQISSLSILLVLILSEFFIVSYAHVALPALAFAPTPTMDLSPTEIPIDAVELANSGFNETVLPWDAGGGDMGGCFPNQVEWLEPGQDDVISGKVELKGTVNITDFGFYKYEYSQDNTLWNTIQAGNMLVTNATLGFWDTSSLPPGDYFLRLVVTNNKGEAKPPCQISIKIQEEN